MRPRDKSSSTIELSVERTLGWGLIIDWIEEILRVTVL